MSDEPKPAPPTRDTDNAPALDALAGVEAGFALSVLDSSPDCIKLIELDGRLSFMNRNGLCAMEITDFTAVARQPWPAIWPAEATEALERALDAARRGEISYIEAFCPTAKGTPRWWHVTVAPVRDAGGRVQRIMATSRDITASIQARQQLEQEVALKNAALDRQKILLGEIDHRVKNSFAAVIALLRLQARSNANTHAAGSLSDAANRIATLARVHEQLQFDPGAAELSLGDYLHALARDLCGALDCRFELAGAPEEPVLVNPGQAAAIGQILAELMSNSAKHGQSERTRIVLDLSHRDRQLVLRIDDDGPGLPDDFHPDQGGGLGMQICQVYAAQMGGALEFGRSELGGASFRISLTLDPRKLSAA